LLLDILDNELTDKVIGAYYKVYNALGYGYLEKVYENAMKVELNNCGEHSETQKPIQVLYKGVVVGKYFADILVEEKLIVELKSVTSIIPAHETQLASYLKSTGISIGLLLNFGPKAEFKRKIWTI